MKEKSDKLNYYYAKVTGSKHEQHPGAKTPTN